MRAKTENPARFAADRAPKRFCLAAESYLEGTQNAQRFQALFLVRRFRLAPAIGQVVAALAFAEARQ
jgi:hypothetical protein